jgi:hypothetical protein
MTSVLENDNSPPFQGGVRVILSPLVKGVRGIPPFAVIDE